MGFAPSGRSGRAYTRRGGIGLASFGRHECFLMRTVAAEREKKNNQKLKSIFIENFVICFLTVFIDAHFLQLRFAIFFICILIGREITYETNRYSI